MVGKGFQCSSASRKFLRCGMSDIIAWIIAFQCSSASRKFLNRLAQRDVTHAPSVSVLFSEPKIPHFTIWSFTNTSSTVSVLFSEPKIPHQPLRFTGAFCRRFSALQRAENSSAMTGTSRRRRQRVSVLFSEPKIPQPTLAPASIHISDRDDHASSFLSLPGASP